MSILRVTRSRGMPSTRSPLLDGDDHYQVWDTSVASCFTARTGVIKWQ